MSGLIGLVLFCVSAPPPVAAYVDGYDLVQVMGEIKPRLSYVDALEIVGAAMDASDGFDVDVRWLLAVAYTESGWKIGVRAGDGGKSFGLFQMMIPAGRAAIKYTDLKVPRNRRGWKKMLNNVNQSARLAAALWVRLRDKYGKRADVVYNCGPIRCGRGKKMRKKTPATRKYWKTYKRILALTESGCGEGREMWDDGSKKLKGE
jgi:hypothetical protein